MATRVTSEPEARSKLRSIASLALYGALVASIGMAGWYGWTRLVLPLAPLIDPALPPALTLFGLLAGTAALFSPCAFPLFPAYITLYLTLDDQASLTSRVGRSLWYGLVCGLGAIVFFLLMGVGLAGLGGALSSYLIMIKLKAASSTNCPASGAVRSRPRHQRGAGLGRRPLGTRAAAPN